MAFAWIKIEDSTPDKPEVWKMAERLGIDADAVVGKLVRVWIWADHQTIDGNAVSVTSALLDRCAGVTGFAAAMAEVGWLKVSAEGLSFVNFDRHNGETAKKRALTRRRVEKHRIGNADSVTETQNGNARGVTKRREEKNNKTETETRTHARGEASGESQPPASDPVLQDLDAPAEPVVIPEAMRGPEVLRAARQWFRHLQVRAPERVPQADSEQLRAFWVYAGGLGPDRFLKAVAFSVGRGYSNLVEEVEHDARVKQSPRGAAPGVERLTPNQQRERNNRRAFEAVFGSAPSDWEGSGSVVRREADRLLAEPAGDLGDGPRLLPGRAGGDGSNEGGSQLRALPPVRGSCQADSARGE